MCTIFITDLKLNQAAQNLLTADLKRQITTVTLLLARLVHATHLLTMQTHKPINRWTLRAWENSETALLNFLIHLTADYQNRGEFFDDTDLKMLSTILDHLNFPGKTLPPAYKKECILKLHRMKLASQHEAYKIMWNENK